MGGNYCRGAMGASVVLAPLATGVITVVPTNAREVAARWLHMTATSVAPVSPVVFTQAFTVSAIQILGDNQLANAGPVIGSTWAAEQTDLREFWNKYITSNNPLTITCTNPDSLLPIEVFAAVKGDFNKS
jgi:L-cystine uptake protein TcyP (sodium:dicarboxylate symporter family)